MSEIWINVSQNLNIMRFRYKYYYNFNNMPLVKGDRIHENKVFGGIFNKIKSNSRKT